MLSLEEYANKISIPTSDLLGRSRKGSVSLAREVYWYYLKKETGMYLSEIAAMFGRKQHSTISSGIKNVNDLISVGDKCVSRFIEAIS